MKRALMLLALSGGAMACAGPQAQSVASMRPNVATFKDVGGEMRIAVCSPDKGLTDGELRSLCGEPKVKIKSIANNGADRADACWVYENKALYFGAEEATPYLVACFETKSYEGLTRESGTVTKFQVTNIFGLADLPPELGGAPKPAPVMAPPAPPAEPAPAPEEPPAATMKKPAGK